MAIGETQLKESNESLYGGPILPVIEWFRSQGRTR